MHRHEPPVTGDVVIVVEEEDILVIDKPSTLPIHPTGRHNTLLHLLQYDMGYTGLHTINRLDRLTSGLVLLAKTKSASQRLDALMRDRKLHKTYVTRVRGVFPEGETVCEAPIRVVSHKLALHLVDNITSPLPEGPSVKGSKKRGRDTPEVRTAKTRFERISTDNITSVIRCYPMTGRTHQIRTHLLHLGFPIANDPIYADPALAPLANMVATHKRGVNEENMEEEEEVEKEIDAWVTQRLKRMSTEEEDGEKGENVKRCEECGQRIQDDPKVKCLWLHAMVYEYEGEDGKAVDAWRYETAMPHWATQAYDAKAAELISNIVFD